MNGQAFIQLVIEMRAAQKCWFETRKYVYLNRAKELESQVDSRGKYRSRTFPQLAKAIAKQWGSYVLQHV